MVRSLQVLHDNSLTKKYSINFVIQYLPDVAVHRTMNSTFEDKRKNKKKIKKTWRNNKRVYVS